MADFVVSTLGYDTDVYRPIGIVSFATYPDRGNLTYEIKNNVLIGTNNAKGVFGVQVIPKHNSSQHLVIGTIVGLK